MLLYICEHIIIIMHTYNKHKHPLQLDFIQQQRRIYRDSKTTFSCLLKNDIQGDSLNLRLVVIVGVY